MDLAYNPHAERARRKNRSSTNINHLTLAPLTVKLPINDDENNDIDANLPPQPHTSYIQGKSAPTTPRLLSRSPAGPRVRNHVRTGSAPGITFSKSKSSTHLSVNNHARKSSGTMTPGRRRKDEGLHPGNRNDSDWLLRTGAMMSSEAREYKGQAWLVSRQSSTSLAGLRDADEEAFEHELAREREMASRHASRRGSQAVVDEVGSRNGSGRTSRSQSMHSFAGPRSYAVSPLERAGDSYFETGEDGLTGPDFVNLDEKLEELEQDTAQEDEITVKKLVRKGQTGDGSWVGNAMAWSLFAVEENEDDSEDDEESLGDETSQKGRTSWSVRHAAGVSMAQEEKVPPPTTDEGGWKDAAWLLSVATKVMF